MHWEAVIERVWRCTKSPRSSELKDALGDSNEMSLEAIDHVNLEPVIKQVWGCTSRPRSSELRDALGGYN